jgi:hypothetical protein
MKLQWFRERVLAHGVGPETEGERVMDDWRETVAREIAAAPGPHGKLMLAFGAIEPERVNDPAIREFLNQAYRLWESLAPMGGGLWILGDSSRAIP